MTAAEKRHAWRSCKGRERCVGDRKGKVRDDI
jgi:hypothetical protein